MRTVVAALVMTCALGSAAQAAEDCTLKQIASLDVLITDGAILVPVGVQDHDTYFQLDTGGVISTLDPALVADLHLLTRDVAPLKIHNGAGELFKRWAHPTTFRLGPLKDNSFDFLVGIDNPNIVAAIRGNLPKVEGVLAPDILSHFDVEIDFATHKVNLYMPHTCKGRAVYWSQDYAEIPIETPMSGHIQMPVTLDGKPARAIFDTGAVGSAARAGWAAEKFGLTPDSPDVQLVGKAYFGGAKTLPRYMHKFNVLDIGGVQFKNPVIGLIGFKDPTRTREDLNRPGTNRDDDWDMLFGLREMRLLHIFIAYKEHMLYITAANAK